MFTYYTIIGKDLNLLKGHISNVKDYAGFNKLECEKEILVIVYKNKNIPEHITQEILDWCQDNNVRTYVYEESTSEFLLNLYACWNLGYSQAKYKWVFRGGSDQVFSKDSFLALWEQILNIEKVKDQKVILQANTIENRDRLEKMNCVSRHLVQSLGNNFEDFNLRKFEFYVNHINKNVDYKIISIENALKIWNKPTRLQTSLGIIDRVDGCSWLMTKEQWEEFGPLEPLANGITGDVLIHDRMQQAGYIELIVRDCVTYHFVQGESKQSWS